MNTKNFLKTGLAFASLLFVFSSCEKQLEIAPRQSIEASTALTSKDAIEASLRRGEREKDLEKQVLLLLNILKLSLSFFDS